MYVLKNLISNLENSLSNKDIFESIVLRTSNVKNFDFQIDNLVKLQKNDDIKEIEKSFSRIIDEEICIKNYEITSNFFVNLEIDLEVYLNNYGNIVENINTENSIPHSVKPKSESAKSFLRNGICITHVLSL